MTPTTPTTLPDPTLPMMTVGAGSPEAAADAAAARALLAGLVAVVEGDPATPAQVDIAVARYGAWLDRFADATPLAELPALVRVPIAQTLALVAVMHDLAVVAVGRRGLLDPGDGPVLGRACADALDSFAAAVAATVTAQAVAPAVP
jgi:hypothetical protein